MAERPAVSRRSRSARGCGPRGPTTAARSVPADPLSGRRYRARGLPGSDSARSDMSTGSVVVVVMEHATRRAPTSRPARPSSHARRDCLQRRKSAERPQPLGRHGRLPDRHGSRPPGGRIQRMKLHVARRRQGLAHGDAVSREHTRLSQGREPGDLHAVTRSITWRQDGLPVASFGSAGCRSSAASP